MRACEKRESGKQLYLPNKDPNLLERSNFVHAFQVVTDPMFLCGFGYTTYTDNVSLI